MRDLRCFSDLKYTLMGSLNRLLSCAAKDNNGAARENPRVISVKQWTYIILGDSNGTGKKGWRKRVKGLVQTALYVIVGKFSHVGSHVGKKLPEHVFRFYLFII